MIDLYVYVARQSFVEDTNNNSEMMKVCQWYGPHDKRWLWDGYWRFAFVIYTICLLSALGGIIMVGVTSCFTMKARTVRGISMLFGVLAICNAMPLAVYLSRVCKSESICNESQSNCVNSCEMGSGSWHIFATSFMWISAMITTWSIKAGGATSYDREEDAVDEEAVKDTDSQGSEDTSPTRESRPRYDERDDDSDISSTTAENNDDDERDAAPSSTAIVPDRGEPMRKFWTKIKKIKQQTRKKNCTIECSKDSDSSSEKDEESRYEKGVADTRVPCKADFQSQVGP